MPNDKALTIEAERWLILNEALEHIRRVQNCTPIEAQRQLKVHIADRTISVKWADSEGANDIPNPKYLQGTKFKVNLEDSTFVVSGLMPGLAQDDFTEKYRPLLVLREAVLKAWPDGTRTVKPKLQKELENKKPVLARTKNENDRLRWMTLVEAEEHIEVLQNCDSVQALHRLKEEIGDGTVAVKWGDDPTDKPDVMILKISEFMLVGQGFAPRGKEYQPLLINRADILRLWPEALQQSNTESGPGRPSERELIWKTLSEMRNEGTPIKGNRTKIAKEVAKRNNRDFDDTGWSQRTVLDHVRDWQKANTDQKMRK